MKGGRDNGHGPITKAALSSVSQSRRSASIPNEVHLWKGREAFQKYAAGKASKRTHSECARISSNTHAPTLFPSSALKSPASRKKRPCVNDMDRRPRAKMGNWALLRGTQYGAPRYGQTVRGGVGSAVAALSRRRDDGGQQSERGGFEQRTLFIESLGHPRRTRAICNLSRMPHAPGNKRIEAGNLVQGRRRHPRGENTRRPVVGVTQTQTINVVAGAVHTRREPLTPTPYLVAGC